MEGVFKNNRNQEEKIISIESLSKFRGSQEGLKQTLVREAPEYFIDKGGAGSVYNLQGGLCLKIVSDRHNSENSDKYDLGNSLHEEAFLQRRASSVTHPGLTRVPLVYGIVDIQSLDAYGNERKGLIMEQLPAVNLANICYANKYPVPEGFDYDSFVSDLENFIELLHNSAQIAHGDLYLRNLMVDTSSSQPYLIDFGRSKDLIVCSKNQAGKYIDDDWKLFYEETEKFKKYLQIK